MKLYKDETDAVCIEEWVEICNGKTHCTEWNKNELHELGDDFYSTTICIIYPKGQRPNLPYPKNDK